jgi:hypothetical protein
MPLLRYADYRPDVSDYQGASSRNVLNVIPQGDGYGPHPGFSSFTQTLPAPCRGAFYAVRSQDASVAIFAGTATRLYLLNNTDFSWIDVSAGGVSYSSLSANAQWQFAQTGSFVFATQQNAVLQVFDLSNSSQFSAALGSPLQASYISVVGPFLVLSGLLSNPFRIVWSGLNNFNSPTSWTAGLSFSDFQDFPDGGIVRGVAGGDQSGIVFQDQTIRSMAYVPGSPIVFQIERIAERMGLYAPYSIIRNAGSIFFYAGQGFHRIDPGGAPVPIGRERVDRTFIADLDKGNLQLFMGAADPRSSRIYWAYKSVAGATGTFDKLLGYDPLLDRFFPVRMSGQFLAGISQSGITLEGLDAIAPGGSVDAMTLSFDDFPTAVQPQLGQFDGNGMLGFYSGAALEATMLTGEQGDDWQRVDISGFKPITDAPALFGSLFYRDTQQAAPIQGTEVALNARTGRCDVMRDARYVRFQLRIPAGTSWSFAAGVVPDIGAGGEL